MARNTLFSGENVVIALLLLTLVSSCSDESVTPPVVNHVAYVPTQLPKDTTELFREQKRTENDTVWIYVQGGPAMDFTRNVLTFFPNNERYNQIQVHQAQTYNRALKDSTLTSEEVELESEVNVEMINRVINYFKVRDKIVVVFSHSYGSWLVLRYLSIYGSSNAHKFVVMAGRLNIESEVYNGLHSNIAYVFPDFVTPAIGGPQPRPGNKSDRLAALLKAVIGPDRNTQRLSTIELTNMLYAYAMDDDLVGRLKQFEIDFLVSKGVTIVECEGGHISMFDAPYKEIIYEFIIL